MKVVLIDGAYWWHRAWETKQTAGFKTSTGLYSGALYTAVNTLIAMLNTLQSDHPDIGEVRFIWEGGVNGRDVLLPEYKAHRRQIAAPHYFHQRDEFKAFLVAVGIDQCWAEGYEADDLIAYVVGEAEINKYIIVSEDKDFWQLLGPSAFIYLPKQKRYMTEESLMEEHGVTPQDYLARRMNEGDESDGIPSASSMDDILRNKSLMDLSTVVIPDEAWHGVDGEFDKAGIEEIFNKYEFKSFMKRFDAILGTFEKFIR